MGDRIRSSTTGCDVPAKTPGIVAQDERSLPLSPLWSRCGSSRVGMAGDFMEVGSGLFLGVVKFPGSWPKKIKTLSNLSQWFLCAASQFCFRLQHRECEKRRE